jgi:hypothetical protein
MEQSEYDEILRSLVRISVHQDVINERQALTNERLVLAIDRLTLGQERLEGAIGRLELILVAIKDILGRGNGRGGNTP